MIDGRTKVVEALLGIARHVEVSSLVFGSCCWDVDLIWTWRPSEVGEHVVEAGYI